MLIESSFIITRTKFTVAKLGELKILSLKMFTFRSLYTQLHGYICFECADDTAAVIHSMDALCNMKRHHTTGKAITPRGILKDKFE